MDEFSLLSMVDSRPVPRPVPTTFVVPDELAGLDINGINNLLASIYNRTGENINCTLELIASKDSTNVSPTTLVPEIITLKVDILVAMVTIQELLNAAGEQGFSIPQDFMEAFEFLYLEWPPVMDDDGEADDGGEADGDGGEADGDGGEADGDGGEADGDEADGDEADGDGGEADGDGGEAAEDGGEADDGNKPGPPYIG